MYEKFYGFSEKPFGITPDPKFFFPSQKHTEALNSLIYTVTERRGFAVITGEIGSGKTIVCRTLLNRLDSGTKVALITNTHLTNKQLITFILEDLEVDFQHGNKSQLLAQLNRFLIEQLSLDFNVILIIDEAQNLRPKVLEEVRMLSNLETEKEKLIQIILMGQPELRDKLDLIELEQLKQRIALYFHISPLDRKETREYINHRLKVADFNVHGLFSQRAIDEIHKHSRGMPRLINSICDRALLTGFINDNLRISADTIEEVAAELRLMED